LSDRKEGKSAISVPDWLRDSTAILIMLAFALLVVVMVLNIGAQDTTWSRYLTILNVVQAFAAAAAGILLGTTIKTAQAKTAQIDARHAKNNLATLANALTRGALTSRQSAGKWFMQTHPVRAQRAGMDITYVADSVGSAPTHWVATKDALSEVDPQLESLAALAQDLSRE